MIKSIIKFLKTIWLKLEEDSRKADRIQDRLSLINEEHRQMHHNIRDLQ